MGGHEVRCLLDTSVWLRGVNEQHTIPTEVLRMLRDENEMFGLSAISLWEVGKKFQTGKLSLAKDLAAWFQDALASNLTVLPISPEIVADAVNLPDFPNRDPADELIVATARAHNLTLLTTDTKLRNYR